MKKIMMPEISDCWRLSYSVPFPIVQAKIQLFDNHGKQYLFECQDLDDVRYEVAEPKYPFNEPSLYRAPEPTYRNVLFIIEGAKQWTWRVL